MAFVGVVSVPIHRPHRQPSRGQRVFRPLFVLLILGALLTAIAPRSVTALVDPAISPSVAGEGVRSALFDAQRGLSAGDPAAATAAIERAQAAGAELGSAFIAAGLPVSVTALAAGLAAAAAAVTAGDLTALALAAGRVWPTMLAGSYRATLAAITTGDASGAGAWLLLRDFRPSTKFARPGADATLAIRQLGGGEITPEVAAAAVTADLLDTYQAQLDGAFSAADAATAQGFVTRRAEAIGQAAGYWSILAPAYETQRGPDARVAADTAFASLQGAIAANDETSLTTSRTVALDALTGFRAAPLAPEEQARRAGQLLLYLSLVPVEYGRGVSDGRVTAEIEIQEAQSFLDGALAAFSDLRLPLETIDPIATAEIATTLGGLETAIRAAGRKESVAPPGDVRDAANAATSALKRLFPSEWERAGGAADFDVVAAVLDQMEAAVAAGQYKQAESARLEAYAIFDAGPEKRLLGFAPNTAARIEALFWAGNGDVPGLAEAVAGNVSSNELRATRRALDAELADAQRILGAGKPADAAVIFNAATIVFREGLEAVLILASLMAAMIGGNQRFKKPLFLGAVMALIASAALFVLARTILLSLSQYSEKVEAIVSLVAVAVLLLVLNWFFHKVYWTRWIAKHHVKRRALIGGAAGQVLGLGLLGFTSVFREGAETVLFLQALVLDAGTVVVLEGTLLGLAGTLVVGILTFVLQTKLPHKKMLIATGFMIAFVLVTMVGHTVHVLQAVGWAPITPLTSVEVPYWAGLWFGVYASWQSLIAQFAAGVFVIGSYYVAEHAQERHRRKVMARGQELAPAQ